MHKGRLEAFTDGVLAIIITIMILEIKVPQGVEFDVLIPLIPKFISYALSFLAVGIYWVNHHHTFQAVKSINGKILLANLLQLFLLSLLPFTTGWVGENQFALKPMVLYGINLLAAGIGYDILMRSIITHHGKDSAIAKAFGANFKGQISLVFYAIGIFACFIHPFIGFGCFVLVSLIWFIPDKRMEKALKD